MRVLVLDHVADLANGPADLDSADGPVRRHTAGRDVQEVESAVEGACDVAGRKHIPTQLSKRTSGGGAVKVLR